MENEIELRHGQTGMTLGPNDYRYGIAFCIRPPHSQPQQETSP